MSRGSEKLKPEAFDHSKTLDFLSEKIDVNKLILERIWWRGQPVPDGIIGRVRASDRASALKFIDDLLSHNVPIDVEVFPLGRPAIQDIQINFTVGR
ncbi:MAG: hypothetical protein ABIQ39_01610 [Ilumatobacteraceae bacterium]